MICAHSSVSNVRGSVHSFGDSQNGSSDSRHKTLDVLIKSGLGLRVLEYTRTEGLRSTMCAYTVQSLSQSINRRHIFSDGSIRHAASAASTPSNSSLLTLLSKKGGK